MLKAVIFDHDGVLADTEKLQRKVWQAFFAKHGISFNTARWNKAKGRTSKEIVKMYLGDYFHPVPGIVSFIKKLHQRQIKIGVASSAYQPTVNYTLERLAVRQFIKAVITSKQITKSKPDPEIYRLTAKKLNVSPKECLVFEDSSAGVQSARRAGMPVILVMTTHKGKDFAKNQLLLAINNYHNAKLNYLIASLSR